MSARPSWVRAGVVASLALALVAVLPACGGGEKAHTYHGDVVNPASPAPEPNLPDQNGKPYRLADRAGRVVLLYFGYTHCPDFCPGTLAEYKQVKKALGGKAAQTDFVMVSVDPERDTPEVLGKYVGFFDKSFIGLTSDPASVEATIRSYGIEVTKREPDEKGNYAVDHVVAVFLIDRKGLVRVTYPYGVKPAGIADDVRYLLSHD